MVSAGDERLRAAELRILLSSPLPLIGALITSAFALAVVAAHIDRALVIGWALSMLAAIALRFGLWWRMRPLANDDGAALRWALPAALILGLSGALWGVFGTVFFFPIDVEIRGIVLLLFASMLASGTIFYSAYLPGHATYVLGCALPLAVASFMHGTPTAQLFGCTIFAYIALILRAAYAFNRRIRRTIKLQLENEVLIDRLRKAKDAAEEANKTKSQFLASMSHELRTPLNAVIGYSEILLEDAEAEGHQERMADLRRINGAGRHLLSLVNDVLDLSKIEAGKMDVDAAPIDLAGFIDDVAATCLTLVERNRNTLDVRHGRGLGAIVGDATKLRQVLLNLLSNAAKFTKSGRITVAANRTRRGASEWISIAVHDTGIGIDKDVLAKLFTNFTQADATTASTYGGTGLGLALSRKLSRLMGGEITAESELHRGSCFTLWLPASPAENVPSLPAADDHPIVPIRSEES
ncbi:MAG TPA: ATP-binding protein [Stellaceae bacterium]|nr:ATP-binding protein [Stellaceae bacterium]